MKGQRTILSLILMLGTNRGRVRSGLGLKLRLLTRVWGRMRFQARVHQLLDKSLVSDSSLVSSLGS